MEETQKLTEPLDSISTLKQRPIKIPVSFDNEGSVIIPDGYRYVPQRVRRRNGKDELVRDHCRLIRPVKRRDSLAKRAEELMRRADMGEASVPGVPVGPEYNLTKLRLLSSIRREINRALDTMEKEI